MHQVKTFSKKTWNYEPLRQLSPYAMQCGSRQASISNPWYHFIRGFVSTNCTSSKVECEKMNPDSETTPTRVSAFSELFPLGIRFYHFEESKTPGYIFFPTQKKHSWEANVLWNLLNHKKKSNDDHGDSLSLTIADCQERILDGEVCLLEDSPFRILRVSSYFCE